MSTSNKSPQGADDSSTSSASAQATSQGARPAALGQRLQHPKLQQLKAFIQPKWQRSIKFLASLKLAVVIIMTLGAVTAYGTIVEAQLDAAAAKKLVYSAPLMVIPLLMLAVSLTAVMIDRWPWQKKHTGFVLAHIGILILMLGQWVTNQFGVDGSVTLTREQPGKSITISPTDLTVFSSMDGARYASIYSREVDFFLKPARADQPLVIPLPDADLKIVESHAYALRDQKFVETPENPQAGSAIRFQLVNEQVNVTEWMLQPAAGNIETKEFGPAQISIVGEFPREFTSRNAILLKPLDGEKLAYEVHTAREGVKVKRGRLKAGESLATGWMKLEFRLLKYLPRAREEIRYIPQDRPTPVTNAAIRVEYRAPGESQIKSQWMGLNSILKLFSNDQVYVVQFANRRIPLGFQVALKKFEIGRYQGTLRAASYQSWVEVDGLGERLISMNEPLKHAGFTFYQASFEADEQGRPVASILSVNRDPGRTLKYFGSLLIVFGTLHLFYWKRRSARAAASAAAAT
ncbi:MAG TPA: cytochrome c biogenesis protein ResB [Pseudobdellovibrionaceae bacterium]|mgnify:CR=1 FL=1|nr:cytochrome c biogenesis protein ResB [Pseudobdellovibrionaceae bacterium]